ncbi:MAG: Mov34/MPN/PAD-1 family protein [Bacteroidota bacterium]|nr:Mov34/MPN/PAD-1 family protein [Bacteroidota bacterium]
MQLEESIFTLSNKGKIKVSEFAHERMNKFKQEKPDLDEAGGVLLGRFIVDSKNIIIDDVTIPMIGDQRRRCFFFRSAKSHQKIIDSKWFKTNGTCNYLGEWHTHPENYPEPSNTDLQNWRKRMKEDKFTSRYLYFIIVGIKEFYIWEGDRRTLKFKKLEKI